MADAFSIKFDVDGVFRALDALESKSKTASRPAAQAGAQVLVDEVRALAPKADAPHVLKSGRVIQPGALKAAVYQVYSKDASRPLDGLAVYHISYNAKKAPHGSLVEYGHVQARVVLKGADGRWFTTKAKLAQPRRVAARPFIRPAFDNVNARALQAAKERWVAEMKGATATTQGAAA